MCQEVHDSHSGIVEPNLAWKESHIGTTWFTLLGGEPPTFLAYNVKSNIFPASSVQRPTPIQDNRCFIDIRKKVSGSRGRSCTSKRNSYDLLSSLRSTKAIQATNMQLTASIVVVLLLTINNHKLLFLLSPKGIALRLYLQNSIFFKEKNPAPTTHL